MTQYAKNTSVSVEKSRAEIERLLQRYGCDDFAYRTNRKLAQLAFSMHGRMLRFDLQLPDPDSEEFCFTPNRKTERSNEAAYKAWEQAVETGITTFEREFLANMIVPGGKVFHEVALPQIAAAYETGKMPPLLGPGS